MCRLFQRVPIPGFVFSIPDSIAPVIRWSSKLKQSVFSSLTAIVCEISVTLRGKHNLSSKYTINQSIKDIIYNVESVLYNKIINDTLSTSGGRPQMTFFKGFMNRSLIYFLKLINSVLIRILIKFFSGLR